MNSVPTHPQVSNHSPTPLTAEQQKLVAEVVKDGLTIQDRFRPEPRYRDTGHGHYEAHTVDDVKSARERKQHKS